MASWGARPAAGCPCSSASSNARSEPEETSGAHSYPESLYLELSMPNALTASCGAGRADPSRGLRCLGLRAHVPASPHVSVQLQDEKTSEKGKTKLF